MFRTPKVVFGNCSFIKWRGRHIKVLNYSDRPGSSTLKPKMLQRLSLLLIIPLISQEIGALNSSNLLKRAKEKSSQLPPSLLNIITKIYLRSFMIGLDWKQYPSWITGLRPRKTTIDQAIILQHWVEKYTSGSKGSLYAGFFRSQICIWLHIKRIIVEEAAIYQ